MTSTAPTVGPKPVHVIGGGLAGSEAAWQIARRGVPVVLHEMRPVRSTAVHKTGQFAELVCSNSFRSDDAGGKRHRPPACRDAPARLAGHARGRRPQAAGGRGAGRRPRRICRRHHRGARSRAADRNPPRGSFGAAAGVGQRHRRHRPAHLARARRRDPPADRRRRARLLRRHRARSSIATPSISTSPGFSRATTRPGRRDRAPTTSIVR